MADKFGGDVSQPEAQVTEREGEHPLLRQQACQITPPERLCIPDDCCPSPAIRLRFMEPIGHVGLTRLDREASRWPR